MFFDIINENHQLFIGLIAGLIPTVMTLYTQKKFVKQSAAIGC